MLSRKPEQEDSNDSILRHFILVGIFLAEALARALNLLTPVPKKSNNNDSNKLFTKHLQEKLSLKTDQDLREILKGIDLISYYEKDQLIDAIISNPDANKKLLLQERRDNLRKMRNDEIKDLLRGVKNLSKLKKSELIELVLSIEFNDRKGSNN